MCVTGWVGIMLCYYVRLEQQAFSNYFIARAVFLKTKANQFLIIHGLNFTKLFLLSVDYHTLNILVRELYGQEKLIINYYKAVFKTLLECYCVTRNKPIRCSVGKIKYNQQW